MAAKNDLDWLTTYSASEGIRFFRKIAKDAFRSLPVNLDKAAQHVVKQLGPLAMKQIELEGSETVYFNWARMSLGFWDRLVAHRVTPAVAERVRNVSLASVPEKAPHFLTRTWLIEVCEPLKGERLFGDTTALGAYLDPKTGCWNLVGWLITNGRAHVCSMFTKEPWTATGKPDRDGVDEGYLYENADWGTNPKMTKEEFYGQQAWYWAGVQYAMVFGALLEAENTFLHVRDETPKPERSTSTRPGVPRSPTWITRYVSVDSKQAARKPEPAKKPEKPLSTDGLEWIEVPVREHLRLQRHGEGNQQRKWIRIKAHMSHRWASPNPKRVIVTDAH